MKDRRPATPLDRRVRKAQDSLVQIDDRDREAIRSILVKMQAFISLSAAGALLFILSHIPELIQNTKGGEKVLPTLASLPTLIATAPRDLETPTFVPTETAMPTETPFQTETPQYRCRILLSAELNASMNGKILAIKVGEESFGRTYVDGGIEIDPKGQETVYINLHVVKTTDASGNISLAILPEFNTPENWMPIQCS